MGAYGKHVVLLGTRELDIKRKWLFQDLSGPVAPISNIARALSIMKEKLRSNTSQSLLVNTSDGLCLVDSRYRFSLKLLQTLLIMTSFGRFCSVRLNYIKKFSVEHFLRE